MDSKLSNSRQRNLMRAIENRGNGIASANEDFKRSSEVLMFNIIHLVAELNSRVGKSREQVFVNGRVFFYIKTGLQLMGFEHEARTFIDDLSATSARLQERLNAAAQASLTWSQYVTNCRAETLSVAK